MIYFTALSFCIFINTINIHRMEPLIDILIMVEGSENREEQDQWWKCVCATFGFSSEAQTSATVSCVTDSSAVFKKDKKHILFRVESNGVELLVLQQ